MKIMTKILINNVKSLLMDVIDEEKTSFFKGIFITNNTLLSTECFHLMKKKSNGKKGMMILKLDMGKDTIEWNEFFLEGFSKLRNSFQNSLILNCISIVSFHMLINRYPSASFRPNMGLCQGDSISPYIFILYSNIF